MGSLGGASGKEPPANAGVSRDAGSLPELGRSPGVGSGSSLQYSRLGSSMDRGAWRLQPMRAQRGRHDWARAEAESCLTQRECAGLQAWEKHGGNCYGRGGEEAGHIEVLPQRAGSLNIKRLLIMKENQIAWVKELSAFPGVGRCKSLGSLKWSSHVPVSSLGPVSFLCHWHRCLGIAGLVLLPGCPGGQESV